MRILFVCKGNICRSPAAEAVLRSYAERSGLGGRLIFDSAGTHGEFHTGQAPDDRIQHIAACRGYDLSELRARRVTGADFEHFELILAMDWENLDCLRRECPPEFAHKLDLLLPFAGAPIENEVPDPYCGDLGGFTRVIDLLEAAATGVVGRLTKI